MCCQHSGTKGTVSVNRCFTFHNVWNNTQSCVRQIPGKCQCQILDVMSGVYYYYYYYSFIFFADFFVIKPTRCTNFTNLFCHETLHVSDSSSVHHQELIHCTLNNSRQLSSRTRMELQFHPIPTRKLSTNLYDIYHC